MLDINQDDLRKMYHNYVIGNGIKESHIARVMQINRASLCKWKKKRSNFRYDNFVKLYNYLVSQIEKFDRE